MWQQDSIRRVTRRRCLKAGTHPPLLNPSGQPPAPFHGAMQSRWSFLSAALYFGKLFSAEQQCMKMLPVLQWHFVPASATMQEAATQ